MAYNLERVTKEFNAVCEKAGTPCKVPVTINGRLSRTLGRVCYTVNSTGYAKSTKVEFSRQLLETSTDESIRDVILHEAAHYILTERTHEEHGHDSMFKKVCAEIGTTNDKTTTKVERTVAEESLYKYIVYCPTCKKVVGGYRRMCKTLQNLDNCYCNLCKKDGLIMKQNW